MKFQMQLYLEVDSSIHISRTMILFLTLWSGAAVAEVNL
jgi:hypothetical protein